MGDRPLWAALVIAGAVVVGIVALLIVVGLVVGVDG